MKGTNKPLDYKQKAEFIKPININSFDKPSNSLHHFLSKNRLSTFILPLINANFKENYKDLTEAFAPESTLSYYVNQLKLPNQAFSRILTKNGLYHLYSDLPIDLALLIEVADFHWHWAVQKPTLTSNTRPRAKAMYKRNIARLMDKFGNITNYWDI